MSRRIPPAECTEHPWWFIAEPARDRSAESVAQAITGPYFSRESAEHELKTRAYAYSRKAIVWCASGHRSPDWQVFCEEPTSDADKS